MLVDFHTHVYPEKIAEKGTITHLRKMAAQADTTHVVLLGVAIRPSLVDSINHFTASLIDEHKIGFGTIHAGSQDKPQIIKGCQRLGLKGIKIHPDMQGFAIDDPRMHEVYAYLSNHQIPILMHVGDPRCADPRYDLSHPRRLAAVMDAFPDLKVIAAHFGGYGCWEQSLQYLCGRPNLWMDTSSSLTFIPPELARQIIHAHGYEHFLFGTDYPITDQKAELQRFAQLHLTETEKNAILYENAAKLLQLQIPARSARNGGNE